MRRHGTGYRSSPTNEPIDVVGQAVADIEASTCDLLRRPFSGDGQHPLRAHPQKQMVTVQFVRTPPIHQVWMVVDEIDQLNSLFTAWH